MILSYSFARFRERIISGIKTGTIRRDEKKRWRKGMTVHHWMGNPRNGNGSHPFAESTVADVWPITIDFRKQIVTIETSGLFGALVYKSNSELQAFAIREGFFTWKEFKRAFQELYPGDVFSGRYIVWEQPVIRVWREGYTSGLECCGFVQLALMAYRKTKTVCRTCGTPWIYHP